MERSHDFQWVNDKIPIIVNDDKSKNNEQGKTTLTLHFQKGSNVIIIYKYIELVTNSENTNSKVKSQSLKNYQQTNKTEL